MRERQCHPARSARRRRGVRKCRSTGYRPLSAAADRGRQGQQAFGIGYSGQSQRRYRSRQSSASQRFRGPWRTAAAGNLPRVADSCIPNRRFRFAADPNPCSRRLCRSLASAYRRSRACWRKSSASRARRARRSPDREPDNGQNGCKRRRQCRSLGLRPRASERI
ncbi:hypothetical protein D9M72_497560 [compost metagenome]